jgi:hypothetical protein
VSLGVLTLVLAASGCGSTSAKGLSHAGRISVRSVEVALVHQEPPQPTQVDCRVATVKERSTSPFGKTQLPLFTCKLTLGNKRASYVVQVLHNGCFVAERHVKGQAVYGCGVKRA